MTDAKSTPPSPVLGKSTLVLGSILTVVAVVAAVVATFVVINEKPSADEAALRAILAGSSSRSPVASPQLEPETDAAAQAAPIAPTLPAAPTAAPTEGATTEELPTPTPEPTSEPQYIPTPTALPTPAPLPTTISNDAIVRLVPGRVTVPVGPGLTFELVKEHDSIHLPGLSALYVDGFDNAEVDIFTPRATTAGRPLVTFDDVVEYLESDPLFAGLVSRPEGGYFDSLRVARYKGATGLPQASIGFYTHSAYIGNGVNGWYVPQELELYVLDLSSGPVIVTGEAILADPLAYGRAVELMQRVISTLEVE